jgi:hypothetical protein
VHSQPKREVSIFKRHYICRACGCAELGAVLGLGNSPLANAFSAVAKAPEAPLVVMYCPRCTLVQLSVVVDPAVLYQPGYAYVQQSRSASMQAHFAALSEAIFQAGGHGRILEVGSNDGSFLTHLAAHDIGTSWHGMDPAATGTAPATRKPFDEESALLHAADYGCVDLLVARHVFAHLDDWTAFIRAIDLATSPEALVVIEVPDALAAHYATDWPYFYHEHLSLVTRPALDALLSETPWSVVAEHRFPIHGGSVAYFLRRSSNSISSEPGLSLDQWVGFRHRSLAHIASLRRYIRTLRDAGASICGYGAPARASVIASACEFTRDDLSFIVDWTPGKVGCLLPGTDIPVVNPDALLKVQPDYALLLSYTYESEILAKESAFRERGGRFILPFPEPHLA